MIDFKTLSREDRAALAGSHFGSLRAFEIPINWRQYITYPLRPCFICNCEHWCVHREEEIAAAEAEARLRRRGLVA